MFRLLRVSALLSRTRSGLTPPLSHRRFSACASNDELISSGLRAVAERRYNDAISLFEKSMDARVSSQFNSETNQLVESTTTATADPQYVLHHVFVYNNVGEAHRLAGSFTEAKAALMRALNLFDKLPLDVKHAEKLIRSSALNNLGLVYIDMLQPKDAIPHLLQSVGLRLELGDAADAATVYNNLGLAYSHDSQFALSRKAYNEALEIVRHLKANPNSEVDVQSKRADKQLVGEVYLLGNLGLLGIHEKKYEEALATLHLAEGMIEQDPRSMSGPDYASVLNNIALACFYLKKYNRSHEYYSRAIALFEASLGQYHPRLYSVYVNFATLCGKMKGSERTKEGREAAMKAKAIAERILTKQPER
ncbi:mitochondrial tetratricopeptide repeat (TPR) domain-containing protein [Andalucia godoyi]|uniref:Mitochondrial tetratricopeptide repeat (TPR) domain-containing protein n=1 Tax=Andalucia godoyi TaxID=505711 RepID=A0A8K0AJH2_ANDGO|nr:mitochondrial tetratricopeptide repeat (TPR) domain-containing protein [Andalucia godoyi]|eukprot:ANDGO_04536.mRNA.1 mitochondrial tetratricopeptide repeat (TPR) domain-containing protein